MESLKLLAVAYCLVLSKSNEGLYNVMISFYNDHVSGWWFEAVALLLILSKSNEGLYNVLISFCNSCCLWFSFVSRSFIIINIK